ncbi:unnamed protein product [Notodromas monacha]|uniref:Synaptic vesicular amine transporter n=1 Tax=Notodromas monacha TaxID=399045 RepID=A0A7R9BXV8_9CRUS|nr:unnamed protein product [Notodromas monacha]CAG0923747.1 unnamed protein product [Notodromas monacha]
MVDSSMMPELGHIVDVRHSSVYGSVYAIGDVAFCLGFAIGPAISGELVKNIGFEWMLYIMAFLCFLYAPLMLFIRNVPMDGEVKALMEKQEGTFRYVNYVDEEEDEVD